MRELKKWADSRPDMVFLHHMIRDIEKAEGREVPEFRRWRLYGYLDALWEAQVITGEQWALFRRIGRATQEVAHV